MNQLQVIPAYAGIQDMIPAQAAIQSTDDKLIEVFPVRISAFYEFQLPHSSPFLDLLLSSNGALRVIMRLVIYEHLDAILALVKPSIRSSLCCQTRCTRLEVIPVYNVPFRALAFDSANA